MIMVISDILIRLGIFVKKLQSSAFHSDYLGNILFLIASKQSIGKSDATESMKYYCN